MHGGIDEKRKNSPCVGGEGKRAVNKGSMNEKESASISEANNRGFHESCPRVIPSFRIFRLAKLRPKTGISFFFLNRTYQNWNTSLRDERTLPFRLSLSLSLLIPYHRVRRHATMKQPPTSTPGHMLLEQRSKFVDRSCTGLSIIAGLSFALLCPMERTALWGL